MKLEPSGEEHYPLPFLEQKDKRDTMFYVQPMDHPSGPNWSVRSRMKSILLDLGPLVLEKQKILQPQVALVLKLSLSVAMSPC